MKFIKQVPASYTAKVSKIQFLNSNVVELKLTLENPKEINFIPGQFISLCVGDNVFRSYSISSDCYQKTHVSVIISVGHNGIGSNFVKSLKIGDKVTFIGPSGRFVLNEFHEGKIFFVATGSGLAPLLSMLSYLSNSNYDKKTHLLFGVRNSEELFKINELDKLTQTMRDFGYTLCLSRETHSEKSINFVKGRVTDLLSNNIDKTADYYICGNPDMVSDTCNLLTEAGVPEGKIHHERFTWSKSKTA